MLRYAAADVIGHAFCEFDRAPRTLNESIEAMHWFKHRRRDSAAPQLLELCWRMKWPSGRIMMCGIYRTQARSTCEVRVRFGEDELLHSSQCARIEDARTLALQWKQNVTASGDLEELPTKARPEQ